MSVSEPGAALAGIRVIEISGGKAAWCGKLLADMGAEVIKVEAPGGSAERQLAPFWGGRADADRSISFLYSNTSKCGITLDLASVAGAQSLRQLARGADLIIESLPVGQLAQWGLSFEQLRVDNPALVMTSISDFGQSGPHSHYRGADIVAAAMGGAMCVVGNVEDPPVMLAGSQAYVMAGTMAAASSMIALYHSAETGAGQHVDISAQESMLAVSSICGVGKWLDDGVIPKRYGTGLFAAVPSGTYACQDGSIYLIVNRPLHWQTLARWVSEETGNQEILDPMFEGPSSARQPYRELLDMFISELTARYTVDAFYREGQHRHLAVTPLSTAHGIARDHHLCERGFYVDVAHGEHTLRYPGPPYRLSATPWRIASPAPRLGQHNARLPDLLQRLAPLRQAQRDTRDAKPVARSQALAGLRVVEFTAGMAGPWIGRIMAWCGADVIKVESREYPDVTRLYVPPRQPDLGVQSQLSPWFTDWNAGKRFVALDLTRSEGTALARELIDQSDIVIDNNANGVMEKLGLGFEQLLRDRPELILLSSTGYGKFGPDARYISWGPNIETLSGLSYLSGFSHRDCTMTQFAYPDPSSALYGLFAILCALEERRKSGRGQLINLSQLEATVASIGHLVMEVFAHDREPEKLGNGSPNHAPQGCYPCSGENRWCVISVSSQLQWRSLCAVLERPLWLDDARFGDSAARLAHRQQLDALIAEASGKWQAYELMHALQAAKVPAGVVQNVEDQYRRDPHLAQRHYFETIEHQLLGAVTAAGIPLGLSATPGKTRDTGRCVGSDNHDVFCQLLGLSETQYQALLAAGVIET